MSFTNSEIDDLILQTSFFPSLNVVSTKVKNMVILNHIKDLPSRLIDFESDESGGYDKRHNHGSFFDDGDKCYVSSSQFPHFIFSSKARVSSHGGLCETDMFLQSFTVLGSELESVKFDLRDGLPFSFVSHYSRLKDIDLRAVANGQSFVFLNNLREENVLLPEYALSQSKKSGDVDELDRSESLTGPDNDNNAVRDDIDAWIDKLDLSKDTKNVLTLAAAARQEVLTMEMNADSVYKQTRKKFAYNACFKRKCKEEKMLLDEFKNAKFGEDKADRACFEIIQNLSSITFNTEKRARKNLEFEKYLRGRVIDIPEETCQ